MPFLSPPTPNSSSKVFPHPVRAENITDKEVTASGGISIWTGLRPTHFRGPLLAQLWDGESLTCTLILLLFPVSPHLDPTGSKRNSGESGVGRAASASSAVFQA